jgi:hypothetical protein
MQEFDALIARVVEVANDVLKEKRTPIDGATELWLLSTTMRELSDALLPFVGLASEWADSPAHRTDYDRDITIEMERLRRRFGK